MPDFIYIKMFDDPVIFNTNHWCVWWMAYGKYATGVLQQVYLWAVDNAVEKREIAQKEIICVADRQFRFEFTKEPQVSDI